MIKRVKPLSIRHFKAAIDVMPPLFLRWLYFPQSIVFLKILTSKQSRLKRTIQARRPSI
jgi:hypothetical protein